MDDLYDRVQEALGALSERVSIRPRVGVVIGSGLGALEEMLGEMQTIPYTDIPNFPKSTAPGHEGNLLLGRIAGEALSVLQGRFHFYEGYLNSLGFYLRMLHNVQHYLPILQLDLNNAVGEAHHTH